MESGKRIESDREVLLDFYRRFIRCPSPNPPGDTRETAGHIRRLLMRHGVDAGSSRRTRSRMILAGACTL
jgi:hypothetical protein